MKRLALITLAALAATTGAASASDRYGNNDYRRYRIEERQTRQLDRIYNANRAGELTRRERGRLLDEQSRIGQMARYAKRDGYVSRGEARWIKDAQNGARRHIYRESTDNQYRW